MPSKPARLQGKSSRSLKEFGVSTARSGAIFVTAEILSSAISLIILVIATRLLNPVGFGLLSIAIAFSTVLGMAGNFGLGTTLRKMLPEVKSLELHGKYISSVYAVSCSIALILAAATFVLSGYIANQIYANPALMVPLQLAGVLVFANVFFNSTSAALVGINRIRYSGLINIAYAVFQLIAVGLLVYLGYGVVGAMAGFCIGLVAADILGIALLAKSISYRFSWPSMEHVKRLTSFSIPILISNLGVVGVTNFAIVVLGIFASPSVVGNYGAAFKVGSTFALLLTSSTFILLPTFTSALSRRKLALRMQQIYNSSVYYSLLLLAPVLAYVVSNSAQLISLIASGRYTSAPFYLAVISIGTMLGIIGSYAGTLLIGYGGARRFMRYQITVVIIELALLLVLTPVLRADGVLIALFIAAPLTLDVIYTMALERSFSISISFGPLIRIVAAAVMITLVMLSFTEFSGFHGYFALLINFIITLLLYPPLVVLLGAVETRNIEFIRQVSTRFGRIGRLSNVILDYAQFFIGILHKPFIN